MSRSSSVRVTGPLKCHREDCWAELLAQGYSPLSALNLLRVLAHLSRWLEAKRLKPEELDSRRIKLYLEQRRAQGCNCWLTLRGLEPILRHLRRCGRIPAPESTVSEATDLDLLLKEYERYLLQERAMVPETTRGYLRVARQFLSERFHVRELDLARLSAADVTSFILRESTRGLSVASMAVAISRLRSLLRYLYVQGKIMNPLAYAAPGIACRRLVDLPKALEPGQVRDLLRSCDRRTSSGRRAYAVLLLMVRMGLRAGEVSGLRLEDIDWARGEVILRGKRRREDRLPLPQDVGDALVAYLKRGRPPSTWRQVFLRAVAPHDPTNSGTVSGIVSRAAERAGLPFPVGSHRLRHTAATTMLRQGASLWEIAQVLRHSQTSTTEIYAKVDRQSLRELGRPWKGAKA